jgi:hypothetical protein
MYDASNAKHHRRLMAGRLRIMAAEADLLRTYARALEDPPLAEYYEKLASSLRGRADKLESEATP